MKTFYCLCFFISCLLIVSCNNGAKTETSTNDTTAEKKYELVWADEFNGSAVDTTNWNFEINGDGGGNHEQEYYKRENASVANDNLIITGKKENYKDHHYTSSRMTTQDKHEFLYGKIEANIKIPVAQGFWPAFWMLGANINEVGWPKSGETDIMEHINADSLLYGTLHWDSNGHVMKGDTIKYNPSAYHVYAIEWDSSAIKWFVDGKQFHEVNIKDGANNREEFHKPSFILVNFALGGDWPGQKIDNSKLPANMYVDYVRVYQKK